MPTLTTSQKVAIAVSVPIVAVALYVFLKWARDDDKDFDDVEVEEEFATSSRELVLEVKVAQEHVGAIIGRGGTTIKQIQKESQTRMNLKDDNEDDEGEEEDDEKQRMRTILVRGSRERAKHAEILVIRQLCRISGEVKCTVHVLTYGLKIAQVVTVYLSDG